MDMASFDQSLLSDEEMQPTMDLKTSCNLSQDEKSMQLSMKSVETTPIKSLSLGTPAANLFSEKALEVQRTLQSSLTLSLRKESEMKPKLHTPVSEILQETKPKTGKEPTKSASRVLNFSNSTASDEVNLSTFSSSNKKAVQKSALTNSSVPSVLSGPTICLSTQFPSSLSPIKPCLNDNNDKSLMELSEYGKGIDDDPNTKKLMEFIQNLEKGTVADSCTLAERMNQLSFLLKNSSLNSGSKSDTEEVGVFDQAASTQCRKLHEKNFRKELAFVTTKLTERNQMAPSNPQESKTVISRRTERNGKVAPSQQFKSKTKSSYRSMQPTNPKSVHFTHVNKMESKKQDTKPSNKNRKSKSAKIASENTIRTGSISHHYAKTPVEEKVVVKSPSKPIQEIDAIRNNLHSMMNLPRSTSLDYTDPLVDGQESEDEDTLGSSDTATLLRAQPAEMFNLIPTKLNPDEQTDGLTSELFSILKSGPNKQAGHSNRSSIDSTVATEIGILRDTLEKETYRRKHCEKQIQRLQRKVLEVQQELAVSHSTDRKKDVMIEQLDKTLAKVVGGWKVHEANLVKTISDYASEKEENAQEMVKLKELLINLENELAKVLEELVEEKERVLQMEENEKAIQQSYKARAEEIAQLIDQKNEQAHKQQRKMDDLIAERKRLQCEIDDLSEELKIQGKNFAEKEAHWEEAVVDIEKRQKDLLEKEKSFTQRERKRCTAIQSSLTSTEQEVSRLQSLLEAQRGEVESMQTHMDVLETKHQSDIQKLEAEHKIKVEKQIMDKLAQVHQESQANESRIRDNHKKQMLDLMSSHKRELESQCRRYENELQKRNELMRQTIADREEAMNEKLKTRSEEMRKQMLDKMQNLLQSHYNETLQVVGNTTGVSPQRAPIPSNDITMLSTRATNDTMMVPVKSSEMSQQINMPSLQQPTVIKPIPTMPSTYNYKSAFSTTSFVSLPSRTTSQPLLSHSTQYQPVSSPTQGIGSHENEFLPVHPVTNHLDAAEVLPNLSLISSISHGAATTLPAHVQQSLKAVDFLPENISNNAKDYPVEGIVVSSGLSNPSLVSASDSLSKGNLEEIRKTQLQHYVHMLMQRSPGEPVETSTTDQSPNHEKKIEDKENADMKIGVAVSQSGAVLQQLLNQENKVSPDVILLKNPIGIEHAYGQKSLTQDRKKLSNLFDSKHGKQNVRFAQDTVKGITVQSTMKPMMASTTQGNFLSPLQVGEISQILDLYSTSATPTGETRLAAEQILRYLRDTNPTIQNESSMQPTSASSPVKRSKQDSKSHDSFAAPGGRTRTKTGTSPGKPNPVWR